MRLLIKLESLRDQLYQPDYHHSLQGFIYSLLKDTSFHYLHDKTGYKFYCFSNIFPPDNVIRKGDIKNLLVSSPNADFIRTLYEKIEDLIMTNAKKKIGNMEFALIGATVVRHLKNVGNMKLSSGTPIIIRINREKYTRYGIRPQKPYHYLYWRSEYPLDLFITQLEDNLRKKYHDYFKLDASNEPIFQGMTFLKEVSNKLRIGGREYTVIGSLWNFEFYDMDSELQKLIKFGMDTGFGELNSMGFGFMNEVI
jgi:CRISPR-associated endoribonuclease Cas6